MKLISALSVVGVVSLAVLAGCGGSDGKDGSAGTNGENGQNGQNGQNGNGTPSPNAVDPAVGYLGRDLEVSIGFDGSKFDEKNAPKVDFGAGIKVAEVRVVSPTLLKAKITVDRAAGLGMKDVKIGETVAAGAFEIRPSLKVTELVAGEQGGVGAISIDNIDTSVFDTGSGGFSGLADDLIPLGGGALGPYAAQALFLVPPSVSGKMQYAAANMDAVGQPALVFYSAADALNLKTRTPATVAFGTAKPKEAFTTAYGSKFYKFASQANKDSIVSFKMHVEDGTTELKCSLFGAGGTAKDLLAQADAVEDPYGFGNQPKQAPYDHDVILPTLSAASKDYFLSVVDTSGDKANAFDLLPVITPATTMAEPAAAHNTPATAATLTVPAAGNGLIVTGEVTDDSKLSYFKLTVAKDELIEFGLDAPAQGLLAVGPPDAKDATKASFKEISAQGKLSAVSTVAGDLVAGTAYLAVAGAKGKFNLAIRRLPAK